MEQIKLADNVVEEAEMKNQERKREADERLVKRVGSKE